MIIEIDKNNQILQKNPYLIDKKLSFELDNNPFGRVLILEEEDEIIGYLYFSDIYDRAEINQFEIIESKRNCGKGNLLLKEMISLVDKDITLEVREDNIPAIHLYKKNHFTQVAIRENYYNGVNGLLMERKK